MKYFNNLENAKVTNQSQFRDIAYRVCENKRDSEKKSYYETIDERLFAQCSISKHVLEKEFDKAICLKAPKQKPAVVEQKIL